MSSFLVEEKKDESGNGLGVFEAIVNTSNSWGVTVQGDSVTVSFSLDNENFVNETTLCENTPLEYIECDVEAIKMTSDKKFWYRVVY
jgi:hypothetical protein